MWPSWWWQVARWQAREFFGRRTTLEFGGKISFFSCLFVGDTGNSSANSQERQRFLFPQVQVVDSRYLDRRTKTGET